MSSINSSSSIFLINSLNRNNQSAFGSLERLATGSQINRASDNPSGLIASESFSARLNTIQSQITITERNEAVFNTQDARLGATLDNIGDLGPLAVQAANTAGMGSAEMGAIQTQVSGILSGINQTASGLGIDVMNDVTAEMVVGVDETTGDDIIETVSLSDLSRVMAEDPAVAQELIDGAREMVVGAQAQAGIDARAAASERRVLEEEQINVARAYSQTRDTDYARESSNLIRSQILSQATTYTILAERQSATNVLALLGGPSQLGELFG